MDTRELTYREGHEPHNQALIYDEDAGVDVAVTYNDDGGATAAEIVKRWNAYPELIEKAAALVRALGEMNVHQSHYAELRTLLQSLNP